MNEERERLCNYMEQKKREEKENNNEVRERNDGAVFQNHPS